MADQTKIEWTDATWSPITGCTLVDDGCNNCYAAELAATRLKNHPSRKGLARKNASGVSKFTGEVRFNEQWLEDPLRWRNPRMIFVCAHGDLFHPAVPDDWIDRVFAVMALCPQHTFQVLTKRPERASAYLHHRPNGRWPALDYAALIAFTGAWNTPELDLKDGWPLPNVWLGTSVSDQKSADERIPHLLDAPAAVRFVSAEPLLGPVDLSDWFHDSDCTGFQSSTDCAEWAEGECSCVASGGPYEDTLDWVIVGGESGRNARPMHPDWARNLRDQCADAGAAFFFKQWGHWLPSDQACPSLFDGSPVDPIGQWDRADADERGALHHWDDCTSSIRLKKKQAGRFLDGVEHNGMPS